jgi:hypothetical protein
MDWSAIGAIAEIIGAAGVVVSLMYLAYQVRQNTRATKAGTRQALADGVQRLASDVVEVDDIARVMFDAMEGKKSNLTRGLGFRHAATATSASGITRTTNTRRAS